MKIRNEEIVGFGNFLMDLTLKGTSSRMRTRLVKKLQKHLDEVQEEKDEIITIHGILDEEGNVKTKTVDGREVYEIRDNEACMKEISDLYKEEFVIEENEENRQMLTTVRDIVLNCDKEFQGQEAMVYDYYCEIFENLTYDKELAR
jgi:hypothetical protein